MRKSGVRIKGRFTALPQMGLRGGMETSPPWVAKDTGGEHQHKLCSLSPFPGLKGIQEYLENPGSNQMAGKLEQELGGP